MSPRVAAPVLDEHLTIVRLRPDNATIEFACAGDPSKEVRMNNAITAIRDTALSPAAELGAISYHHMLPALPREAGTWRRPLALRKG